MEEELQPEFVETSLSESTAEDEAITIPDNKPFLGYIYKIQFPNGKHYIGLTISIEQRTRQHKNYAKNNTKLLYRAIRKYDMIDNLELVEIDTATTFEELCEKEIEYIQIYNSHYVGGFGYNMTLGGEGVNGYIYTEEDKLKISAGVNKHYTEHPESRLKMREISKKYHENNPEAAKEQRIRIKKYFDEIPDARERCSKSQIKRFENQAERDKCSKNSIKQWESQVARQQMSELKKKYYEDNPEVVKENSERLKKYYEDNPEARELQRENSKKQWDSQVARQQMSEIKKKFYDEVPDARRRISDGQGKNKPFDIFTKDGTFVKTFCYQFEAKEYLQKEYNITSNIIIGPVLSGKLKSCAGFVFKYKTV